MKPSFWEEMQLSEIHRSMIKTLIYARLIELIASYREIDFDKFLAYELAAYPPSMFNSDGEMNISSQLYVQSNSAL